jgi:excisionase family DNA binding protein
MTVLGPDVPDILTVKEVGNVIKAHENYVYTLVSSGDLPSFKIGGKRRVAKSALDGWLQARM